jgi:hypothetical protein
VTIPSEGSRVTIPSEGSYTSLKRFRAGTITVK